MKHQQHIYTPKKTGPSDVFLNGNRIERVIYADTKRGFVRVIGNPAKIDKYGKRVLWKTLHGAVEVRLKVGAADTAPDGYNDRVEGRDAASSRRVPSHDWLCGNGNYNERTDK